MPKNMTDEGLIGYLRLHSLTPMALVSGKMIKRIYRIAGHDPSELRVSGRAGFSAPLQDDSFVRFRDDKLLDAASERLKTLPVCADCKGTGNDLGTPDFKLDDWDRRRVKDCETCGGRGVLEPKLEEVSDGRTND